MNHSHELGIELASPTEVSEVLVELELSDVVESEMVSPEQVAREMNRLKIIHALQGARGRSRRSKRSSPLLKDVALDAGADISAVGDPSTALDEGTRKRLQIVAANKRARMAQSPVARPSAWLLTGNNIGRPLLPIKDDRH